MRNDEAEVTGGPFIGRFWELLLVDQVLAELRDGRGGLLLVTGRAGMGKTRIVAELAGRARTGTGCVTVVAEASGTPGLWRRVLTELTRVHPDIAGQERLDASALRLAAAALWQRIRMPLVVAVDGIHATDSPDLSIVDDLLPDLGDVPLLLVLTATTSHDDAPPQPFPRWHSHRNTTLLELRQLPVETVLELVETELPGVDRKTAASIAAAGNGNPGIARELCGWTTRPGDDTDAPATTWLTAALADSDDVLAAMSAVGEPVVADLISGVVRADRAAVAAVLDTAAAAGFVVRDQEVDLRYRLSHPLVGCAARVLAGPERMALFHRRIAKTLAARQAASPSPVDVRIATHLLAAGERGPDVVRSCVDAVRWLAAEGSFGAAIDFATEGMARDPDPGQETLLLMLTGRCAVRSGAWSVGLAHLERAMANARAMADRELFAHTVVEYLETVLTGRLTVERQPELLVQALRGCPPNAIALRARLEALRALMICLEDAPGCRAIAEHAVTLAEQSGNPEAIGLALAARTASPVPHELEEYARIAAEASRSPAWGALPAIVYSSMATGQREKLDAAQTGFPVAPGDRFVHAHHAEFAAGKAILDAAEADLLDALRRLVAEAPRTASFVVPAAAGIWRAHTDRVLPPGVKPPAPRPDLPRHIALLTAVMDHVMPGGPVDRQRLTDLVVRLPDPARVPRDFTWSTWQAITARTGVLLGDADRCTWAVEQLLPFADQFAVLGTALPIGPIGWFLADPLWLLGRGEQALDANTTATRVSRDLRSHGWVARCLLQRGQLLREQDPATAVAALTEAREIAHRTGMTPLAKQAEKMLGEAAEPAGGHRTIAPEPKTGPATLLAAGLSPEDIDIIRHAAAGNTNAQIAKIMHLSVPTIERRLSNTYRRLGVRNRAQAVSLIAHGLGR